MSVDVAAVQDALKAEGLDGWLLYDFQGVNPIAPRVAGIGRDGGHLATRRWFYLDSGGRRAPGLVHAIERHNLDHLPGPRRCTRAASQLEAGLKSLLAGIAPGGDGVLARQRDSVRVPGRCRHRRDGARARRRGRGVAAIWSSTSTGSGTPRPSHPTARPPTSSIASRTAPSRPWPGARAGDGDHGVRHPAADGAVVRGRGPRQRLGARTCRRKRTPAIRTTCPRPIGIAPIRPNELLLIDLWGKLGRPGAVYADITWVGFTGAHDAGRVARAFEAIARRARRRGGARPGRGPDGRRCAASRWTARRGRSSTRPATGTRSCIARGTASARRSTATARTSTITRRMTSAG